MGFADLASHLAIRRRTDQCMLPAASMIVMVMLVPTASGGRSRGRSAHGECRGTREQDPTTDGRIAPSRMGSF